MIKYIPSKRIPKRIRSVLIQKCNQEDFQTLYVKSRDKNLISNFTNRIYIKIRNWMFVEIGNKFEVPFISVFLTQKCSLRCINCSDLIPFYKEPQSFPCNKVLFCLQRYLASVDSVHFLLLCGGETFLYPDLENILLFCIKEKKIRNIGIVTNGTIIPNKRVCDLLSNSKIRVRVSDYKCVNKKRKQTICYLKNNGVLIEELRRQKWYDVGGFSERGRNVMQMKQIFGQCLMNNCFEINKNKVIYCARQRSSELGLTPKMSPDDYVSLKIEKKEQLKKELLNMYQKSFITTCNYCDGITQQSRRVIPGEQ